MFEKKTENLNALIIYLFSRREKHMCTSIHIKISEYTALVQSITQHLITKLNLTYRDRTQPHVQPHHRQTPIHYPLGGIAYTFTRSRPAKLHYYDDHHYCYFHHHLSFSWVAHRLFPKIARRDRVMLLFFANEAHYVVSLRPHPMLEWWICGGGGADYLIYFYGYYDCRTHHPAQINTHTYTQT